MMNRAQRRAQAREQSRAKSRPQRRPTTPRHQADAIRCSLPLARCSDFTPEEAARLTNEARLAWHHITHGSATTDHFDSLATASNVALVLAESIGPAAIDLCIAAQLDLIEIKSRYQRLGQFGAHASALRTVPAFLDFYADVMPLSTPQQMVDAVRVAMGRIHDEQILRHQADPA